MANQSQFTLDCEAAGWPPPDISWLLNGEANISEIFDVEVHENGSLTVTEARLDNVGLFTCVASSQAGISQSSAQVDILMERENITSGVCMWHGPMTHSQRHSHPYITLH